VVGKASKTGEFDAAARIDFERQLGSGPLLQMERLAALGGWPPLGATLCRRWGSGCWARVASASQCQPRKSGLSRDCAASLRRLDHIRRRGRRKTRSSVGRRENGGRLTEQLHKWVPCCAAAPGSAAASSARQGAARLRLCASLHGSPVNLGMFSDRGGSGTMRAAPGVPVLLWGAALGERRDLSLPGDKSKIPR
ncbi:unnamed protein product, partial [Prorocentrum cordatum]